MKIRKAILLSSKCDQGRRNGKGLQLADECVIIMDYNGEVDTLCLFADECSKLFACLIGWDFKVNEDELKCLCLSSFV